jgi:hypothetical protein
MAIGLLIPVTSITDSPVLETVDLNDDESNKSIYFSDFSFGDSGSGVDDFDDDSGFYFSISYTTSMSHFRNFKDLIVI